MAQGDKGSRENNSSVERICAGGCIDVECGINNEVFLGVFEGDGKPYVRVSLLRTAYIDDLIGALKRARTWLSKRE